MRLVVLAAVFLSGCASYATANWNTDLRAYDGQLLEISGKPVPSSDSLMSICPPGYSGADLANCLDVVAPEGMSVALRSSSPSCAVVSGRYKAFGIDRIGIGTFRSNLGYIEAARVGSCHER
jgi:hypothetical protein